MKYFLLLIFISVTSLSRSADLYVSPTGSDSGDGSIHNPYKTIVKARNEARKIHEHVTIFLRGGKYKITETVVFGIEDGNVTYQAYNNEIPVITSAIAVGNWEKCIQYPTGTPENAKGNLWVVDIPPGVSNFKVLFDNNQRLERAHSRGFQTPELKFKKLATRNIANKNDFDLLKKLPFPEGAIKNWSNLEDVEVFFCGVPWTQNIASLEKVDLENNIAWLSHAGNTPPSTTPKSYNPTYIENIIDVLDTPGEWCVNTKTRKLYYWPINDEPSNNISVPTLIEFFKVEGKIDYNGTNDIPVENINFKGLTFTKGDRYSWWKGHKGYGIQHDWDKFDYGNAMLRFRGAEDCKVSECSFVNSGNSAIRLDLHAQNITIENSLIDRIGHMGILLCGYGPGIKDVNKNNKIVNNIIRRVGEVIWHGHAIFVWQSGENYIANNHIREVPRKAIGICGVRGAIFQNGKEIDWDEAAKTIRWNELKYQTFTKGDNTQEKILPYLHARNNVVENNYIYRSRTKIGDGASLNVSGAGTGNVIRRNMLYMTLGNGMRCDDWQNETTFEENLILSGGIVHKGKNDLLNNIFVNTNIRFSFYPDQQPNPGSQIKGNIFYTTRFIEPYVGRTSKTMSTPDICDVENNIYFTTEGTDKLQAFINEKEAKGIEKNATLSNPEFKNPIDLKKELKSSDFNLKNEVADLDFSAIGLTKEYPDRFLTQIFPYYNRKLISENAIVSTNATSSQGNLQQLIKTNKENLEHVFEVKAESTPFIQLELNQEESIQAIRLIADFKDRNNSMRGLTIWASINGTDWQEIWHADPYHIAMGRDWNIQLNEPQNAKYLRVGLRSKELVQLAKHDDRGKDLNKELFFLNSVFVYGAE